MRALQIESAVRTDTHERGYCVTCRIDVRLGCVNTGTHQGYLAFRLFYAGSILEPRGHPLPGQIENGHLLREIGLRDIQKCMRQVELKISPCHGNGERESRGRLVGFGGLHGSACGGQRLAIAAPEVDLVAEVQGELPLGHEASRIRRRVQAVLGETLLGYLGIHRRGGLARRLRPGRL